MRASTLSATAETTLRALVPDLLAYFGRRLDDPDDAADALGETLLVVWRRRSGVPEDPEEMRRYAFGVARKVLLVARRGRLRRRALAERVAHELAAAWAHRPEPVDDELRAALARLESRDRELVLLVAWEGFGVAEAGAVLGLKPDAARQRYSRARARLRELLRATESFTRS